MALAEIHPEQQPSLQQPDGPLVPLTPPLNEQDFFLPNSMECDTLQQRISDGHIHRYVEITIDGFSHRGWYTPADREQATDMLLVTKPGLGEIVDNGIGFELHRRLAKSLPEVSVFSHETDGIGHFSEGLSLKELLSHGIGQMSQQGLELLKRFGENKRIITLGTSMGTVIFNQLLLHNLDEGEPVDIAGVVNFAPALVDPKRVLPDMLVRFMPALGVDVAKEIFMTDRRHFGRLLLTLVQSRPSLPNVLPLGKQVFDLISGTPQEEVEEVVAHYATDIIVGTKDSVGQLAMWEELAEEYPQLAVHPLQGRGHGVAVKPYETSKKLSRIIRERHLATS